MAKRLEVKISGIEEDREKFMCYPFSDNGRDMLVEDIGARGLMAPITLWDRGKGFSYLVISGHHRLAAVKLLGWDEIPAIKVVFESELDAVMASIRLNSQDEFTGDKRTWFHRFQLTLRRETEIRQRASERQKSGVSVKDGKGDFYLLAPKLVGLQVSRTTYYQLYSLWKTLTQRSEDARESFSLQVDIPSWSIWKDALELKGEDWEEFLSLCKKFIACEDKEKFGFPKKLRLFLKDIYISEKVVIKTEKPDSQDDDIADDGKADVQVVGEVVFEGVFLSDEEMGVKVLSDMLKNGGGKLRKTKNGYRIKI